MSVFVQILVLLGAQVVGSDAGMRSVPTLKLRQVADVFLDRGAEILSVDHQRSELYVVGAGGVSVVDLGDPAEPAVLTEWGFGEPGAWEPTSVAVDPLGRGFAVATWIPHPPERAPGILQIIDTKDRRVLWGISAGFHPDCVTITPDGARIVIANECEPGVVDRPGGITVVELRGIREAEDFRGLSSGDWYGFTRKHLADGVGIDGLRNPSGDEEHAEIGIEPEYLAATNEGVWVTLQENNALGYFDFAAERWTRIRGLGLLDHAFDSSDTDGINIRPAGGFVMLPQPDTVVLFEGGDGRRCLLFANEGEQGDPNRIRFRDAWQAGMIDAGAGVILDALNNGDVLGRFGRLWISTIDGDLDNDGDIDQPTALGGRSISVLDAESGELLWDSGSLIEELIAERWPDQFNAGDSRSDKSGPEPEGLAVGEIAGRVYGFVGLERARAVMMFDLTDPKGPVFIDAAQLGEGYSPEGLACFLVDGRSFLAVASELAERLTVFEIVQ